MNQINLSKVLSSDRSLKADIQKVFEKHGFEVDWKIAKITTTFANNSIYGCIIELSGLDFRLKLNAKKFTAQTLKIMEKHYEHD